MQHLRHLAVMIVLVLFATACASTPDEPEEPGLVAVPTWPREYVGTGGVRLEVYQPQIIAWRRHEEVEGRAAIAVSQSAQTAPALGTIRFSARTDVDLETRRVRASHFELTETRFPTLSSEQAERLASKIQKEVMPDELVVTLDHVLASVERGKQQLVEIEVKTEPPPIYVSTRPALLLQFDGAPILAPVHADGGKGGLRYILNTNWDLLVEADGTQYLLTEDGWLIAPASAGPWKPAAEVPEGFSSLPNDDNWKAVRASVASGAAAPKEAPRVFVSERPAELILIEGDPKLESIGGTLLQDVVNTESNLFLSLDDGHYYYLVSGRWFRASDLAGPWTFATPDLPEEFSKIPTQHRRAPVRASVPGTPEAQEAAILAQIPQKATVQRADAKPTVSYTGEPEFVSIEGTKVAYATNTPNDVLQLGEVYYLCFQGVWFTSPSPKGPWETADSVPPEIYAIPPSSPIYHVTYVRVYSSTPDTVVVGYSSGYMGTYYSYGVVVYGTGWYYPPYYYYYDDYPYYYSHPVSYGSSSWYNSETGFYRRSGVAYGPYGGIGRGAAYNPTTGTYARGGAAWGPNQSSAWAQAYNPRTGSYAATRQGSNAYGSWGRSVVGNGDNWVRTGHYSNSQGTVGGYKTSRGGSGVVVQGEDGSAAIGRTANGQVYAGKDGNVYRRGENGWEQHGATGWSSVPQETLDEARNRAEGGSDTARANREAAETRSRSTREQLERDHRGRTQGADRHERYQSHRGGGGWSGGRGGGRGGRGGGGRRGGGRR